MLDLSAMNEAQKEAVTHGEGPLLVLAGPGSGKTFVITQRIFYLLQKLHIPPEQILVITFTKEAARSMQSRFREQSKQIYPVNFGTFHSCFYHILKESHVLENYKIAAEAQKREIVSRLRMDNQSGNLVKTHVENPNQHLSRHSNPRSNSNLRQDRDHASQNSATSPNTEIASHFLQAFSFYKNTYDEQEAKKKLPMEYQESFRQMFQAYEQERERRRLLDFDDMVYQCRSLLMENLSLRTYWQSRFSHILMDEFQDINPMQYEVVKLLAGEKAQLFAVGDDDQSIYGFRGSKPACLKQFQKEFGAKEVYLSVNYRSTPEIVQASLKVISENKQRFEKNLISSQSLPQNPPQNPLQSSFPKALPTPLQPPFPKIPQTSLQNSSPKILPKFSWKPQQKTSSTSPQKSLPNLPDNTDNIKRTKNMNNADKADGKDRKGGEDKADKADKADGADRAVRGVNIKTFEEREAQYDYLAQELSVFTALSPEDVSIGVLFRTNSYMQGFAAKLSRMGIPYDMKEKITSIYEHFIVKDIMAYLQLAEGRGGREHLLRILNKPLRYLSRESLGYPNLKNPISGQLNIVLEQQNLENQQNLQNPRPRKPENQCGESENLLEGVLCYYKEGQNIAYRRERIAAADKLKKDLLVMKKRPLYLKIQYILKGIGYEKYLKDYAGKDTEKWQEYQEVTEWLCTEAKECENLSEWLGRKDTYEKSLKEMQEKESDGKLSDKKISGIQDKARIHLMTVHASKGLEFDHVWIPDCNEKVFPHDSMLDSDACEEERRIFYVAMTRAKKSLELLCLTGTKEHPRLPSRFLNPLLYSSPSSSNSQLSKYSSNASATLSYSSSSSI